MRKITQQIEGAKSWPYWLPKSSRLQVKLTKEQHDFILPVYSFQRDCGFSGHEVDGVLLCDGYASGLKCSFELWLKRFEYSDIDISNIRQAL